MPNRLPLERVENAFLPAREITDPERFAGRLEQIEKCYLALLTEGANLALVGNRGIGKSSLARQIISMATGSNALLERNNIPFDRKLDFLTIYLACGTDVENTQHLLEKLLSSHDCLASWVYDIPTAKTILTAYKPKFGVLGIELKGEKSTQVQTESAAPSTDSTSVFTNVVAALANEQPAKDGILIVVDEFDQIQDKSGFAGLLKSLATNVPSVRFCIVGVAHDLYELIEEHQSANRLFAGGVIPVPDMSDAELKEVIDIASKHIDHTIVFDPDAKKQVVRIAQGHPYMVHLLGKHALRSAWRTQSSAIHKKDVNATLSLIAESGADPVLESRYKKAIASSPQRESVLRALARAEKGGESWTSDAYPMAIKDGVDNPSHYVGNLVTDDYGAEIVKVRDRYYRFRDSLFRVYAEMRPRQYPLTETPANTE